MKKFSIFLFLWLCCIMYAQSQQLFTKDKSYSTENSSNFKTLSSVLNYDGENYDAVGMQNAGEYGAYAYFPSSAFSSFNGKYITAINVFLSNVNALASSELRLYSDMSSEPFYKESFTAKEGWNTIILDSLLKIGTSTKIYAGYYLVSSGGFHMGCDAGPRQADGYGDIMYWNGSWSTLFDITGNSISANWNIRLLVNDTNSTANPVCTPTAWELSNPVAIGNTKTSENFTLTNIGKDTLTISEISGLSAPFSTSLNISSVKLGEGKFINFNFTFAPTEENTYNNIITIKTNGGDITINLKAESYTPTAIANCTPTQWFISPGIGITAKSGKFTISNYGEANLTCTALSGISEPFSSNFNPANFSNMAPGQSKTFNFLYSPTESGVHNQTVTLETNGGNIEITLKGEAIECDTLKSSWSESFNEGSIPKDWITIDEDGDGYNWISFNKVMLLQEVTIQVPHTLIVVLT